MTKIYWNVNMLKDGIKHYFPFLSKYNKRQCKNCFLNNFTCFVKTYFHTVKEEDIISKHFMKYNYLPTRFE